MKIYCLKSTIVMALLIILCFGGFVLANTSSSHWSSNLISIFNENGYLDSNTDFSDPNSDITKGEFSYIANKYYSFDESSSFDDAIVVSQEHGFMLNAKSNDFVKREEACAIFCQLLSLEISSNDIGFEDSGDITAWAIPYVSKVCQEGIVIGYPDNTFKPQKNLSKAEFITMLSRVKGSGGPTSALPIELIDEDIDSIQVGVMNYSGDVIKVNIIDEQFEMISGETITLSISLPEEYDDVITTVDDSIINYSNDFNTLTATSSGTTEIHFKTLDDKLKKTIKINIK